MTKSEEELKRYFVYECPNCQTRYNYRRACLNHMVKKHGYAWWDNNDVCIPGNQIHNPTGAVRPRQIRKTIHPVYNVAGNSEILGEV